MHETFFTEVTLVTWNDILWKRFNLVWILYHDAAPETLMVFNIHLRNIWLYNRRQANCLFYSKTCLC